MATDSDDAPLKESNVDNDGEVSVTGNDGTTTNNDKKFEFGSKVSITVTKTGYFGKEEEYEFIDSEETEKELTIKLAKEGKRSLSCQFLVLPKIKLFVLFFRIWRDHKLYETRPEFRMDKLQC